MPIKGGFGAFLLKKAAAKSMRQKHATGNQYNKRKHFTFPRGVHQLHKRIGGRQTAPPMSQPESSFFAHLGGDVATRPSEDYTFEKRVDKARYSWQKRGNLQVYQLGGKAETFVCFRCGYPTRSNLQVIKDDNWDWRMCYTCYQKVLRDGMESDV